MSLMCVLSDLRHRFCKTLLVGSVYVCQGGVVAGTRPDQSPLRPAVVVADVGGTSVAA